MSAAGAFRLSVYALGALGGFALALGGLLGPAGLALYFAGLIATWWVHDVIGARVRPSSTADRIMALALASIALADLAWLAESLLDAFTRLVCLLAFLLLATGRSPRQVRSAGLLSFFMLATSAAGAFGVGFLPVFVGYLVAGVAMLLFYHLVAEAEASGVAAPPLAGLGLTAVIGTAVVAVAAIASTLFVVIPRVGEAALPLRMKPTRALTGFTDRVELGAFGSVETDAAIAMRVHLPGGPLPADQIRHVRWRGLVLDHFDGRAWTATSPRRRVVLRAWDNEGVWLGHAAGSGTFVTQEVFLPPMGTETIFGMPPVVRVKVAGGLRVDETGALAVLAPRAHLTYTVESALGARAVEELDERNRARYMQLPPLAPRIPALARRIAAGGAGPDDTANRLTAWLSRELRYSLDLQRRTTLEPLEEFLFVRRAGNCEYFAAALAVMLRSLDIPARVVNGFQRGEWNPYGDYWVVRMLDAHSWVEAHIDGAWVTLDPSPRAEAPSSALLGDVDLYLDGLRLRWYRYVIKWSRQDQLHAAEMVRRLAWQWPGLPRWLRLSPPPAALATGMVLLALVAVAWGWRRHRGAAPADVPVFYARALRRLARRGLRPAPSETAREFCARVAGEAPAVAHPLARLTDGYERTRFGGVALPDTEVRTLVDVASRV